jgi:hypothetical protein
MRPSNRRLVAVGVIGLLLLIAGCAHQPPHAAIASPGFWSGFLDGMLILFSFIGSLFIDVRIYAYPNSGVWYDFGFLIGVAVIFASGGASAR